MEAALWPSTAAPARVVTDATERSAPKQKARCWGETVSPPPLLTLGRTHNGLTRTESSKAPHSSGSTRILKVYQKFSAGYPPR